MKLTIAMGVCDVCFRIEKNNLHTVRNWGTGVLDRHELQLIFVEFGNSVIL